MYYCIAFMCGDEGQSDCIYPDDCDFHDQSGAEDIDGNNKLMMGNIVCRCRKEASGAEIRLIFGVVNGKISSAEWRVVSVGEDVNRGEN